jgi:hypothetical protein
VVAFLLLYSLLLAARIRLGERQAELERLYLDADERSA